MRPARVRGEPGDGSHIVGRLRLAARRVRAGTRARDLWYLGVVLATSAGVVGAVRALGLRIQHTPSLPVGLYRTVAGTPDPGSVALWCLPRAIAVLGRERGYLAAGACDGKSEPVGKIVLAVAGDTIRYSAGGIVLNGCAVPNTRPLPRDSRGRRLAHVPFGTYVLRVGEAWIWSPFSLASYDSRYFGPIPLSGFVSRVTPVWTTARVKTTPWRSARSQCALPVMLQTHGNT